MYAVIGGAGEVGLHIAQSLYDEGYNLAIVDRDSKACEKAEGLDDAPQYAYCYRKPLRAEAVR